MSHWMLIPADNPSDIGTDLPGLDEDCCAWSAFPDPRSIHIEPPLEDLVSTSLPEMLTETRLVEVTPLGPARKDSDGSSWCPAGWQIIHVEVTHERMFGPDGNHVLAAVQQLVADESLADRVAEAETDLDLAAAEDDAVDALVAAGIDGHWLRNAIPCTWPRAVLGMAARDLLDPQDHGQLTGAGRRIARWS